MATMLIPTWCHLRQDLGELQTSISNWDGVGKSDDIGIETHQEECDILEVANKEHADSLL